MIVFDGSGSMSEMGFNQLDEPRIFDARRALREVLPRVETRRRIGLVTYGPGQGEACENVELRYTPMPMAADPIIAAVEALEPAGNTPLTEAVARASTVLLGRQDRGTVVLLTDGKETCGGAPCGLAADLAARHPGITVHVIGFRVRGDRFLWDKQGRNDYTDATSVAQCLADATGGTYTNTETLEELIGALQQTLGCPLFGSLPPEALRDRS